jgi:hypothetical protein
LVELADIAAEIRGKPDIAVAVGNQSMRPGILSFNQRIFFELTGLRIQPAKLVHHLFSESQRAIRAHRGVRAYRGNGPLADGHA